MLQTALLLAFSFAPAQDPVVPGLVEVPAGRTWLGTSEKVVKDWIAESPADANILGAEVPEQRIDVEKFYLGVTEVTNEQYLLFVKATGYMPPASWANLTREQRAEIIAWGKEKFGPEFVLGDDELGRWWEDNWADPQYKWEMPGKIALEPVVFVNQRDAQAYCRWAGLRLPTEEEWVRAARGDTKQLYPFKGDWDPAKVSHQTTKPNHLKYKRLWVNAFKENASPYGCVDMVGNVWEWTESGFDMHKGFKPFKVKTHSGSNMDVMPNFDASAKVIKGGAFNTTASATRVATRAGIVRDYRCPFIGFRVASSGHPGLDSLVMAADSVDLRVMGGSMDRVLNPERVIAVEHRAFADLEKVAEARLAPTRPLPETTPPDGYAVVSGYESIGFMPAKMLEGASLDKVSRTIAEEGQGRVGIFTTTTPILEPSLAPGTYTVMFQPAVSLEELLVLGASAPADDAEEAEKILAKLAKRDDVEQRNKFDFPDLTGIVIEPEEYYLLFVNNEAKVVAGLQIDKPRLDSTKRAAHDLRLNLKREQLDFRFSLPNRESSSKSYSMVMSVKTKPELINREYWNGYDSVVEPDPVN